MITFKDLKRYCEAFGYAYEIEYRSSHYIRAEFKFRAKNYIYTYICDVISRLRDDDILDFYEKCNTKTGRKTNGLGLADERRILKQLNNLS